MKTGGLPSSKHWEAAGRQLAWTFGGGVTSPLRGLELTETCFRACLCCVEV